MFRKKLGGRLSSDGRALDLQGQKLKYDDISDLLIYLEENPNIEVINLTDCGIDDISAIRLASVSYVKRMNLANNKIGDQGAKALGKSEVLTHFNFAGNKKLKDETVKELATNTRLIIEFDDPVASYLYRAVHHDEVKGSSSILPEAKNGAINFADFVIGNKLDLKRKNITDIKEVSRLVKFLNENPQITELDVSGNKFGDAGARVLAEAAHIKKLNIARTGLTSEGAGHIVRHHQYEALNLSSNTLNVSFIALLVSNQRNLSELRLEDTGLTDVAMPLLAGHSSLQYLSVRENKIGEAGVNALAMNAGLSVMIETELKDKLEAARSGHKERAKEDKTREELHQRAEIERARLSAQYAAQIQAEEAREEQKRIEKETIRAAQEEAARTRAVEMAVRAAEEEARVQAEHQAKEALEAKEREEEDRRYIAEMEAKEAARIRKEKENETKQAAITRQRRAEEKKEKVIERIEDKYFPHVKSDRLELSKKITSADIPNVIAFLKAHPEITVLDVSHSKLTDRDVAALMAVPSIKSINLRGLGIGHEAVKGIYNNTHLTDVNVSQNPLLAGVETSIEQVLEINRGQEAKAVKEAQLIHGLEVQLTRETAKVKELEQSSEVLWEAYEKLRQERPDEIKTIAEAKRVASKVQSEVRAAERNAAETESRLREIRQRQDIGGPGTDKKSSQTREEAKMAGERVAQQNGANLRIDSGHVESDEAKKMLENYMQRIHDQWPAPKQASSGFKLFSKKNTVEEAIKHLPPGVRSQVRAYNAAIIQAKVKGNNSIDYTALLVLIKQVGMVAAQQTPAKKQSLAEKEFLDLCKPENKKRFREVYMSAVESGVKKSKS